MVRPGFSLTGRHVLAIVLGFFGIVTAVNGVMIWLALDSWPGLTGAGYRDAAAQNAMLAEHERMAALGWTADIDIVPVRAGRELTVTLSARQGEPVTGVALEAAFRRPVVEGMDRLVTLIPISAGRYRGVVALPAVGQWTLRLIATRDGKRLWAEERPLWLN